MGDLKVTNSFRFAVAVVVLAGIVSAFYFGWPHQQNAAHGSLAQSSAPSAAGFNSDGDDALLAYLATS